MKYFYNPESELFLDIIRDCQLIKPENLIGCLWGVDVYESKLVPVDEVWITQNDLPFKRVKIR
jgi:hypothetical protein